MSEGTEELIVGIDLGTTNSEIAAYVDGKPQVIGNGTSVMLPSCVGLTPDGQLLIGESARNQMLLYPDRTVRSVKRLMGSNQSVTLGDKTYAPAEISALILRELARWATAKLGRPVAKAVITVPAYFSDAQRQATRDAGALAGLEVVRIINEPTAASLAYGLDADARRRTVMVYDLGGGTFDVAIVRIEGDVTEVLASHGNNRLGGDDFDEKLVDHLLERFRQQHDVDLRDRNPGAYARLWWAAESAKKQLSSAPFATVKEESLIEVDGRPLHLDVEVTRAEYEAMIRPLLEQTMDSASRALTDAGLVPGALDEILLVGGSTRTPLVVEMLEKLCHKTPRQDLHPDLCVALGAGVLASRLGGHDVQRVLVDVSPFSFGISYLGERDGVAYPHCYRPIIKRNTPLPVTRAEEYYTAYDHQTAVELDVYQGDDPDAMRDVHVGNFRVEGLRSVDGPNVVLCRMRLDLDGILHVTGIEKSTGLSKHIAITGATRRRDAAEITRGREALDRLFATRLDGPADDMQVAGAGDDAELDEEAADGSVEASDEFTPPLDPGELAADDEDGASDGDVIDAEVVGADAAGPATVAAGAAAGTGPQALLDRCRAKMAGLHAEDREEAEQLMAQVSDAMGRGDADATAAASKRLGEFLFFIGG